VRKWLIDSMIAGEGFSRREFLSVAMVIAETNGHL
jgi:hypothetical protein